MDFGSVIAVIIGSLPVLAVLIAGFVLVSLRRDRLGRRSTLMAFLGLGALTLSRILSVIWTLTLPRLFQATDYSTTHLGLLSGSVNLVATLLGALGIGLLIAALVTRTPTGVPTPPSASPADYRPVAPPTRF